MHNGIIGAHLALPEIGEKLRFEQQVSDVSYAHIANDLLIWTLYNWEPSNLVILHSLESFQYQFIASYANNLRQKQGHSRSVVSLFFYCSSTRFQSGLILVIEEIMMIIIIMSIFLYLARTRSNMN